MKFYILAITGILCINCNKRSNDFSDAKVNSSIKKDTIFNFLRTQKQESMSKIANNPIVGRTVSVNYKIEKKGYASSADLLKFYTCSAKLSDTLIIRIGLNGDLGGYGFRVLYKDGKFKTLPYKYADQRYKTDISTFDIIDQNLKLDKKIYSPGDSIYGKIDFQIVENNKIEKISYTGNASFATKIEN